MSIIVENLLRRCCSFAWLGLSDLRGNQRVHQRVYIMWLISLVCLPAMTQASIKTVFGPTIYERSHGAPVVVTDHFTSIEGLVCSLKIYNGGMEDSDFERVSSTVINLNADSVTAPKEFNQQVSYIEKTITLQESNTLEVEVRGKPGGAVSLVIECFINDPPTIQAEITPPANAKGWHNVDATVFFHCADPDNDLVSCTDPVTLTTEGENQSVVGAAVDSGNNRTEAMASISLDTTLPIISAMISPVPNHLGWNTSDVTVTFTCHDALSGIDTCPAPIVVTTDGVNQNVTGTAIDMAGNSASTTVTIHIDTKPPAITSTAAPTPNAAGWNNTDVTVDFSCIDVGSGVATCANQVNVTAEGAGQTIEGIVEDKAGLSSVTIHTLNIDKTAPTITANVSPAANMAGWHNSDVTVIFTCSDSGSGIANCPMPQTLGLDGANQTVTGTSIDVAGNTASTTVTLNIDKSAPMISATVTPTANAAGWHNTDVTIHFTCTDLGSRIENCPLPMTVSTEGAAQVFIGTVLDSAGNSASTTVSLNIDKTPPAMTSSVNQLPNADGWNNVDITTTFTCLDDLSGVASCTSPVVTSTEGANQAVTGAAVDMAGNVSTDRLVINIDKTPPQISATSTPTANASGWNNTDISVSFVCTDTVSGISDCPAPVLVVSEGADQIINGQAFDVAGNSATASHTVSIDKTAPSLSITSPLVGAVFTEATMTVDGLVSDAGATPSVTVNGVSVVLNQDGSFSQPFTLSEGMNDIVVIASDVAGNITENHLQVTLNSNVVPQITSMPVAFVVEGDSWTYTLEASDSNGDSLSYSMLQSPVGAVLDLNTNTVTWPTSGLAPGNYDFQFTVVDDGGLSVEQFITVELLPAERTATHEGTEFWIPVSINAVTVSSGGTFDINLVSNGTNTQATIEIPALSIVETLSLTANQMATYSINLDDFSATEGFTLNALLENYAIHITAASPISAYFMNQKTSTTDGFLGLPAASLGREYIAATYIMLGRLGISKTVDGGQLGAIITLVATEDNTQVRIDPIMDILPGDQRQIEVGTPIELTMNRGDVYHLETKGSFKADLTGSMIKADKPISVIGQMECVYIPVDQTACDHLVEQLPPIESLATDYYTVPFWGRTVNGRFSSREYGDTFRVVAPYDNTDIYIDEVLRARLNRGEYFEYLANGPRRIRSNHPVLLMQYANGNQYDNGYRELPSNFTDPFMVIVPPAEQFLKQYTVNTPARDLAYNYANLLVPTSAIATVTVDGQNIDPSLFGEIPNSEYSYLQLPLTAGSHHLAAQEPFGTYLYGYDYFESYGYLGGMAFSPSQSVTSLSLSGEATQTLDEQWCAESTAVDAYGRPVSGVRVKFNVAGVTRRDAYRFADAHGIARYCYRANKAGVDTVTASVNQLSQSTAIDWVAGTQNLAPVISSLPDLGAVVGESYSYDVIAEDPEGGDLLYALIEAPTGMSIDASGHLVWPQVDWRSAKFNRVKVVLSLSDPLGLETVQSFELSKYAAFNTAPQFKPATVGLTATLGVPYVYNLDHVQHHLDYPKYQVLVNDVDEDAAFVDILSGPAEAYIQRIISYYTRITRENDPRSCVGCTHYFRWVPQTVGDQPFVLGLRDARGGTAEALSFTVNVAPNLPPQIVGLNPPAIAAVGYQYSYVLEVENDVPPSEYDNLDDLKVIFEQAPTNMRYELIRGNNTQKLRILWNPNSNDMGSHTIRLRVDDRLNSSPVVEFTLNVIDNNQPPVIAVGGMPNAEGSIPYQYQISASDPDGDALTYSLAIAPEGMTVNETTGVINWVPSANYNNEQEWLRIVVTDAQGLTAEKSDAIHVTKFRNRAPEFIPAYRPIYAKVGREYVHQALAIDREGDNPISYRLSSSASGPAIDAQNGTITWTPTTEGRFWLNIAATDSLGNYASANSEFWYVQVVPDTASLDAELQLSSTNIIDLGESLSLTVVPKNESTTPQVTLTVDGATVAVDALLQAQITPIRVGSIPVIATITDGLETITRTTTVFVRDPADVTPPVIEIHSPIDIGDITAPTDIIGTVQDEGLVDVILAYKRADEALSDNLDLNDFTMLYRGSNAFDNEVIANLDTTMLMNGTYHILLQATDANNNTGARVVSVNVTGDLKVGNFSITLEDLNIPLAGLPITVSHTYDSRRRSENLDFGYGWSIDYQNVRLEENREPTKNWTQTTGRGTFNFDGGRITTSAVCINTAYNKTVTVTLPNGDTEKFEPRLRPTTGSLQSLSDPNCYLASDRFYDLFFIAVDDTQSTLETDEGLSIYLSDLTNGDLSLIGGEQATLITHYTLTTRHGYIYKINQDFGVEQMIDPNGNTLTYSDTGIVHSSGESVTFNRDSQGRISTITKPNGDTVTYQYDVLGNLKSVTDETNSVSRYSYNTEHGLTEMFDPLGRSLVKNIYDDEGRLIAQEDSDGNRTDYTHDLTGRQSVVTDRLGRITFYYYDEEGNVTSQVDALNQVTSYTFDSNGNQLSQTDPLNQTSTATYNAANDQLTQTDALGNTVSFTYNAKGQELTITDATGHIFTNEYDFVGNLLSVTDPLDNVVSTTFIAGTNGLPGVITDALGNETRYTYNRFGLKGTETDALGHRTTYGYDASGNLTSETRSRTLPDNTVAEEITSYQYDARNRLLSTTDAQGNITQSEYDIAGNKVADIDALGHRTEYEYDTYNRLLSSTYPDGTTESHSYDAQGNKLSTTDRLGRITRYTYDALDRPIQVTAPDGTTTQTEYDAAGRVIAEIDEKGHRSEYDYDGAGRRTITRDALGNETAFAYDENGNLISQTDANGNTVSYTYDSLDRRTHTTFPDTTQIIETYDALGRMIANTDQAGITTNYEYDALGRLTAVVDTLSQRTSYSYDEAGNKLTQTDAAGRTTRWTYDALGRVLSRTLPLGQIETFNYDANGNQTHHTDFDGQATTFVYDENNRLIQKAYPGNVETYSYDAVGNRLSSHDTASGGTTTYGYDDRNRLMLETQPNGTRLAYAYDATGNRTQVTTELPTQPTPTVEITTYGYDVLNRLATVTDNNNQVTTYTYDNVGNRQSVSYPNGNTTTYTYDILNRLTQVQTKDNTNTVISQFDYVLGLTGRRDQVTDLTGAITTYDYDDLYRLRREDITGHPVLGTIANEYQYDAVGNRTYSTEQGVSTAYSYDNNDRLLTAGGETYTYDANGNTLTTSIDTTVITNNYDANNRLLQMTKTENGVEVDNVSYQYDLDGIRTAKNDDGITITYVVDKNRDYAQVLNELDSTNTPTVSYVYGDDLIKQSRAANDSYYLYDGLGSTRALADNTGNITDTYDYTAYGKLFDSTGNTENSYRYTGEQFDSNLGNYYLRARYYDPSAGRFTQMDTWMGYNQDPVTLHKYAYGNLDPVNHTDPSGNFSIGSLMATVNVMANLVTMAQTAYSVFQVASGESEMSAREVGTEIIFSMLGGGTGKVLRLMSKRSRDNLREKFDTTGCSLNSFVSGTLVLTDAGYVPIEDIEIGEKVLSFNEDTGELSYQEITHLIRNEAEYNFVAISLDNGETILSTPEHPFYINSEWLNADKLTVGNWLTTTDGFELVEDIMRVKSHNQVFNLTVANNHTYYVSEEDILVHNMGCKIRGRSASGFDWDHIFDNHADWGKVNKQRTGTYHTSFGGLTKEQIKARVNAAWKTREIRKTQHGGYDKHGVKHADRIIYDGVDPRSGQTIRFWFNVETKIIESAAPR